MDRTGSDWTGSCVNPTRISFRPVRAFVPSPIRHNRSDGLLPCAPSRIGSCGAGSGRVVSGRALSSDVFASPHVSEPRGEYPSADPAEVYVF